jgi:hypothetical protein
MVVRPRPSKVSSFDLVDWVDLWDKPSDKVDETRQDLVFSCTYMVLPRNLLYRKIGAVRIIGMEDERFET